MRVIKPGMLRAFWEAHRDAEASLRAWLALAKCATWQSFADIRKTFRSADTVQVGSGRQVIVFNIAHNRYRLIAAVHYNRQTAFTLMILSHKEYDRNTWKDQL